MAGIFNEKYFNETVLKTYQKLIPDVELTNIYDSGAIVKLSKNTRDLLSSQVGGNYIQEPITGLIGGEPGNYNGLTDIDFDGLDTYLQGKVVIGRHKGWNEKQFTKEITGDDFLTKIMAQILRYWRKYDQSLILKIIAALFQKTEMINGNKIYDAGAEIGATTINSAIQYACGDLKELFSLVWLHSSVATQLENLRLIEFLKYTDANGVTRSLAIGTFNGKLVVINDLLPYVKQDGYIEYTSYALGLNSVEYEDIPCQKPLEPVRDAVKYAGLDGIISRRRFMIAPYGFTFKREAMSTESPSDEELTNPNSWELVTGSTGKVFPIKAIPMCAIKTRVIDPTSVAETPETPEE